MSTDGQPAAPADQPPADAAQPTVGESVAKTALANITNSALTAAMTAAFLLGGNAVLGPSPTPVPVPPAPAPYDPSPTPTPTAPFAEQFSAAFLADGGTPIQAVERGAVFKSFAVAIVVDGSDQPPRLATVAGAAESFKRSMQLRGFRQAQSPKASAVLLVELQKVPMGALDSTRRQSLAQIFDTAGSALLAMGGE